LAKFLTCQPVAIELDIHFGGTPSSLAVADIFNPSSSLMPLTDAALRESGPLVMQIGDARLDLRTTGLTNSFASARQFLLDQFQAADVDKKGVLDRSQILQNPFLPAFFPQADRDGDGQLSLQELTDYLDLLGKAVTSSTVLVITDHGRGLFELLSPHHDGRLRERELRGAWTRLSPWAKEEGQVTRATLPRQFQLVLSQGQPGEALQLGDGVAIPAPGTGGRAAVRSRGPLWFQKMDRNGDGVVSLREFLGSKEDFQKIDTDGDGLITVEEAERADARYREEAKDKKELSKEK
jgi:Ca2+-binding EF-hand superfamily protein